MVLYTPYDGRSYSLIEIENKFKGLKENYQIYYDRLEKAHKRRLGFIDVIKKQWSALLLDVAQQEKFELISCH